MCRVRTIPLAVAVSCLLALAVCPLVLADEQLLKYDDDMPDGKQSFGGSAHVIKFEAPQDGTWYVDRVDVCASQYGGGYDPAQTFCRVYVCDATMKPLGEAQGAYQAFVYGATQKWGSIEVPSVPVKGPFYLVVAPGSLGNRGLFVAYDTTGKDANNIHSGVGTAGQAPAPPRQPLDWMIRAHLTTEKGAAAAEASNNTILKWDDDTADTKQSYGTPGGMAVRFEPPAGDWVVDTVDLFGGVYGAGSRADRTAFTLAICDEQMNPVGFAMYPYALFTSDMHWVKVKLLPPVPVKGPFTVVWIGNCLENGTDGIFLGADTSAPNGKSFSTGPGAGGKWALTPEQARNWMIRAELKPAK